MTDYSFREVKNAQDAIKEAVEKSQHATTGGRKFDSNKLQYGLLPILSMKDVVKVLTYGAKKYEKDNWKYVPDGENRYFDAALRHIWAHKEGEINDPETGMSHMAHAICCLMFINDLNLSKEIKNEI